MSKKQFLSNRNLLAFSLGLVYLWFGALKFFPGLSPAEDLSRSTMNALTKGLVPEKLNYLLLSLWETSIGFALLLRFRLKTVTIMALVHLIFTFTPLIIFSDLCFTNTPFAWTLVGQYIFNNIVLMAALISIYRSSSG